jgi:signal transduction histidine kinase
MIVPTIATIVVGTAGLVNQVGQASNAERARSLAVLSGDAGNLVHRLQDERAFAVQLLSVKSARADQNERVKTEYSKQQEKTDTANAKYRQTRSTLPAVPDNLRALLDKIETQLGELPVMRNQVEALNKVPLTVTERRYQVLIADLLQIRDVSAQLTGDITLSDRMRAAAQIALGKEFLSQERVVILQAIANGDMSQATRNNYTATLQGRDLALSGFSAVATPAQQELFDRSVSGVELRDTLFLEGVLDGLDNNDNPASVIDPAAWDKAMAGRADQMNTVEVALNEQAQTAATDLGDQVQRRVLIETGLLLFTLLIGVLFAWMVARSMARSLRDLRQGALAVAQYGLPQAVARLRDPALSTHLSPAGVALQIAEPLPVRSKDEFGQVTEAFNAVHLEAVRTAAEQAALRSSVATMFVNLARRSQILVDRLIGHLDRLERGEQDPDRLSELFQLDHLATRMRRNDENLLVLAGADSTRIQREPAALMDVLRAAQSEVEHYTRIEFAVIDQDIEIAAHAVNDLVHLVAELFDNATAFSPPDTAIKVEARRVGDRAVLQVEDRGIGMSPDQYTELNERLATPPMVDVAVSRMMGLVVVARLATRHGVKVELRPAASRGTVGDVLLPSGVLVPRALAGRAHSPAGFPAARTPGSPLAPSSPLAPNTAPPGFGPPLALESGSQWPTNEELRAGSFRPPPTTPPPPQSPYAAPPPPVPSWGSDGPSSGLGAALAGDYGTHSNGGAYTGANGTHGTNGTNGTNSGRTLPAWHDLTGAGDTGMATPPATVGDANPLPQRRPGQFGDPDPDPGGGGPLIPRQPGGPDARDSFDHWGNPGGADQRGTFGGVDQRGNVGGPGYGAPPVPAPPNLPSALSGGTPSGGTPAAVRPPAWPPVAEPPDDHAGDPVPGIPERLSASLDMTSELPRTRSQAEVPGGPYSSAADAAAAASQYANDMTMELPIFRELESAWFRADPTPETPALPPARDSWEYQPPESTPGAGTTQRPDRTTGSDGVRRAADEVSWRSVADDGWLAAQAALDPRDGGATERGLPRRVPMAQLVPGGVETPTGGSERRTPDAVRGLLSAYHRGVQRGRGGAHGNDAEPTTTGSQTSSGREQEA